VFPGDALFLVFKASYSLELKRNIRIAISFLTHKALGSTVPLSFCHSWQNWAPLRTPNAAIRKGKPLKAKTAFLEKRVLNRRCDKQMHSRCKAPAVLTVGGGCSFTFLGLFLAFSSIAFAQTAQKSGAAKAADTPSSASPALSHDLSGIWMQYPRDNVPGALGMDAVNEKFRPPLTAWGQARFNAAFPLIGPRAVPGKENDPVLRCDPTGPPRLLTLPNPFEIIQIPGRVLMLFEEYHVWRTIWTDGRELPKDPDPSWLGYSVGRWDGDTFVVDTIGFNDKIWADPYGDPRSEKMHLTERYRRLNHDTLELAITIDDPKAYTKTWVSPPKLHKLESSWEFGEWFCVVEETKTYDDVVRKPAGDAPPMRK
jgi:hypothetical protein